MTEKKLKPVLLRDQAALAVVYERAEREHRPLTNATAAAVLESVKNPQRRSFKHDVIEKSTPKLNDESVD
jgi:hypothetical protein